MIHGEELVIGEKTTKIDTIENETSIFDNFDFEIIPMDFSHLDDAKIIPEDESNKTIEIVGEVEESESAATEEIAEASLEELDRPSSVSFINPLKETLGPTIELQTETIIAQDGVFVISKDVPIKKDKLNKEFKSLVDSVL